MPFGLINAGATFQRAMDIDFHGLIGHSVVVYLDHVTIFSKNREEHAFHLKQIFKCCRKYGISLNPKKCVFAVIEGKLLGHVVSKKGISLYPITKKVCNHSWGQLILCERLYQILLKLLNLCSKW